MARKDLEMELLNIRHSSYTSQVRECISRAVRSERCQDTSDVVINVLCKTCPDEITTLLAKTGVRHAQSDGLGEAALTSEAIEVIRTFIDEARSYEAELGDLNDDDFEALYRKSFDPVVKAKRDQRARSAQDHDRWAFFNKPDADADFERWRPRFLSPAQAAALLLNKDPDVVTPKSLEPYRRVSGSPFRELFKDRLDLIEKAVEAGELSVPMSTSAFSQWANARGLRPPPQLMGGGIGEDAAFWKQKFDSAQSELDKLRRGIDELPSKSVGSIYRLLLGMAIARFEHRTDQRSNSTKAIRKELEGVDIMIKDDAIRDHLRDAAQHLDIDWRTPIHWSGLKRPES